MKLLILSIIIFLFLISVVYAVESSLLATVKINPIYNLALDIEIITKRVLAGDNLTVLIELNKTDLTKKEITVDLDYEILKPNKEVLDKGHAGEIKVEDYSETTIQISVPTDFKPGRYTLNITATHSQAIASSDSDDFWVRMKIPSMGFFKYFGMILAYFF